MKNISDQLEDAQLMQINNYETFDAPTPEELGSLEPEGYVQICNEKERFWVKITEIEDDIISGVIDNNLVEDHGYNLGDEVEFEKRHIYKIME